MTDYETLAQQMCDVMAAGQDIDAWIERLVAEDFVEHETPPGMDATRQTSWQLFMMTHAAFPDFRVTVHELLQDGDKVAARVTFAGTHQGEFMGVPASGNRVEWSVVDILQSHDDKAIAHWGLSDTTSAMAQMGAAPN